MNATYIFAADTTDIKDDEPLGLEIEGRHVALYRIDGEIYATDNVCPHQFALLSDGCYLEDGCIECPLHQARFDAKTGAVQCGPVDRAMSVYPVRIDGASVLVGLDDA